MNRIPDQVRNETIGVFQTLYVFIFFVIIKNISEIITEYHEGISCKAIATRLHVKEMKQVVFQKIVFF